MIDLPLLNDLEDKASILKNRIRKNYRHTRKWALRSHTNAFRIYDRDIKEYPVAIDYYDGRFCLHCFSSDGEIREDLQEEVESALLSLFGVSQEALFWRTRVRRKKVQQYEKVASEQDFFVVQEYGVKFKVNLVDYLDTGLFLDHRETRQLVASLCRGKRLLNLFAYTCSFSVHAAIAGAAFTKSVDMSNTYTEWGKENFLLNAQDLKRNEIVRADCLKFLDQERALYDIIVIDPPTISRSKKMEGMFDIQEDHVALISKALQLLSPNGILFFSTNSREFFLNELSECVVREITSKTIPQDFHNKKIHRVWKIHKK